MLIPLRAGDEGLVLSWDLEELVGVMRDPNLELERLWAGLLTVMRDSWPDWPIEVWATVDDLTEEEAAARDPSDDLDDPNRPPDPDGKPSPFRVRFALFFGGGEGRGSTTAAAMASFVISAIAKSVPTDPSADWGYITPDWKPMWVIDDAVVYRLYAPEATLDRALYLLGSYAGLPTWFAASEEAWPLQKAYKQIGLKLADPDVSWAFDL